VTRGISGEKRGNVLLWGIGNRRGGPASVQWGTEKEKESQSGREKKNMALAAEKKEPVFMSMLKGRGGKSLSKQEGIKRAESRELYAVEKGEKENRLVQGEPRKEEIQRPKLAESGTRTLMRGGNRGYSSRVKEKVVQQEIDVEEEKMISDGKSESVERSAEEVALMETLRTIRCWKGGDLHVRPCRCHCINRSGLWATRRDKKIVSLEEKKKGSFRRIIQMTGTLVQSSVEKGDARLITLILGGVFFEIVRERGLDRC